MTTPIDETIETIAAALILSTRGQRLECLDESPKFKALLQQTALRQARAALTAYHAGPEYKALVAERDKLREALAKIRDKSASEFYWKETYNSLIALGKHMNYAEIISDKALEPSREA